MIGKKYKKREFGRSTKITISKENVTVEGLFELMGDTKNAYCLMSEYGYYLPEFTSDIMSREYMLDILTGRTWCPMQSEIRMVRPVAGISKNQLKEEIIKMRPDMRLSLYSDPDKEWLTAILSTLNPEHEFLQLETMETGKEIPKKLLQKLRLELFRKEKEQPPKEGEDLKKEQHGTVQPEAPRKPMTLNTKSYLNKRDWEEKVDDYESEEEEFSEDEMEPTENMEQRLKRNQQKAAALLRQLRTTEEEIERIKNGGVKESEKDEQDEEGLKEEETVEQVMGRYKQTEKGESLRLLTNQIGGKRKGKKKAKKAKNNEENDKNEAKEADEMRLKQEEVVADAWNDMIFLGLSGKYV